MIWQSRFVEGLPPIPHRDRWGPPLPSTGNPWLPACWKIPRMSDLATVPVRLRAHLAHAPLQAIAEECGSGVRNIKGPSLHPSICPSGRSRVQADDVLARAAHLKLHLDGLRRSGWQEVTRLTSGGLVEHSTNWNHGELGHADVHVRFPCMGIEPESPFDPLSDGRGSNDIAHRSCTVPSLKAQRLSLLLHAGRAERKVDIAVARTIGTDSERSQVRALEQRADKGFHCDYWASRGLSLPAEIADVAAPVKWRDPLKCSRLWNASIKGAPAGANRVHLRTARHMRHLVWEPRASRCSTRTERCSDEAGMSHVRNDDLVSNCRG